MPFSAACRAGSNSVESSGPGSVNRRSSSFSSSLSYSKMSMDGEFCLLVVDDDVRKLIEKENRGEVVK